MGRHYGGGSQWRPALQSIAEIGINWIKKKGKGKRKGNMSTKQTLPWIWLIFNCKLAFRFSSSSMNNLPEEVNVKNPISIFIYLLYFSVYNLDTSLCVFAVVLSSFHLNFAPFFIWKLVYGTSLVEML